MVKIKVMCQLRREEKGGKSRRGEGGREGRGEGDRGHITLQRGSEHLAFRRAGPGTVLTTFRPRDSFDF